MKAAVAILLETVDPLISSFPGNAKSFSKLCDGVAVQLVVFETPLSLFTHGNTFPGHGLHLLIKKVLPMSLEFSVTYVSERFSICIKSIRLIA
jgi:hypothetical protein